MRIHIQKELNRERYSLQFYKNTIFFYCLLVMQKKKITHDTLPTAVQSAVCSFMSYDLQSRVVDGVRCLQAYTRKQK